MSQPIISIENLSKVYHLYNKNIDRMKEAFNPFKKQYHHKFFALKQINLEIKKGEILGVVGRNGAGKSTLLNVICGIVTPTSGECRVKGRISALLGIGTGFNPELTGLENIYLSGTLNGYDKNEIDNKLAEILAFAEIGEFIGQPLRTYSNGMKARLGFAMAVNIDPEVLVVDEVLAVGDVLFQRKCYAKMEQLFRSGCTVLYVSHNTNIITQICTRAIFLEKGELLLDGLPKPVTNHYLKFIYSKAEHQEQIRESILKINKIKNVKENSFYKKEFVPEKQGKQPIDVEQNECFIPNFKPKETMVVKNCDIEIHDIFISTMSGEKVNILTTGGDYIFRYRVKFNETVKNLSFTMAFHDKKGVCIGGSNSPGSTNVIKKINHGEEYLVEWHFTCHLLFGDYFTNCAVKSFKKDQEFYLIRMIDSYAFKVQKERDLNHTGIVHFNQYAKIIPSISNSTE